MANEMSMLAEISMHYGLLNCCKHNTCHCMLTHFLFHHKAVNTESWQQVVQLGTCRFAEFALLEQPSSESLGQGRPPGPTQVEIVVQVNITALVDWCSQSACGHTCVA